MKTFIRNSNVYNFSPERELTVDELVRIAPSIGQTNAYHETSARFVPIPTIEPAKALIREGWVPFQVFENKVRKEDKHGYQRHLIRFRHRDAEQIFNGVDYNMVLTNANDGTGAYKLMAALYRMFCQNGTVIVDHELDAISIRHAGKDKTVDAVVDASYRIIEHAPMVADLIQRQSHMHLTESERIAYARAALELRWESEEREDGTVISTAPVRAESLLRVKRNQDMSQDLFTTFNVVQEHLIRGGDAGFNRNGGRTTTREVGSITENTKINRALWVLTREMEKLKTT